MKESTFKTVRFKRNKYVMHSFSLCIKLVYFVSPLVYCVKYYPVSKSVSRLYATLYQSVMNCAQCLIKRVPEVLRGCRVTRM
jgi:hypothetical protein